MTTSSINKSTGGFLTFRGPDADKPEARGEFPSKEIASYLRYPCAYCESKFCLVNPNTHEAGGVIQREVLERDQETREITKVGRIFTTCIKCCREILRRQRS